MLPTLLIHFGPSSHSPLIIQMGVAFGIFVLFKLWSGAGRGLDFTRTFPQKGLPIDPYGGSVLLLVEILSGESNQPWLCL